MLVGNDCYSNCFFGLLFYVNDDKSFKLEWHFWVEAADGVGATVLKVCISTVAWVPAIYWRSNLALFRLWLLFYVLESYSAYFFIISILIIIKKILDSFYINTISYL